MSLSLPYSATPEVFPQLTSAKSSQAASGTTKSGGRRDYVSGDSFASRLNESQSKAGARKKESQAIRTSRKNEKTNTDKSRDAQNDSTHSASGEAPGKTLRPQDNRSASENRAAASHKETHSGEGSGSERNRIAPGVQATVKNLVVSEATQVSQSASSLSSGAVSLSEFDELLALKPENDLSARDKAAIARLIANAKTPLIGADTRGAANLFGGAAASDKANAGAQNTNSAANALTLLSDKSAGVAGQREIDALFQRFEIEQADVLEKEHSADKMVKGDSSALRTLTLAPNIRQILLSAEQNKRGAVSSDFASQTEEESPATGEQRALGLQSATGVANTASLASAASGKPQSGFSDALLNGTMLNRSSDPNAALIEELGTLSADGAVRAQGSVSEINPRQAAPSPVRAGFILPDRFGQTLRSGVKSITLQITPQHLGAAQLSVKVVNDSVSGILHVESSAAKAAVEASIDQLAQRLAEEGLSLDRLDVEVSDHQQGQQAFDAEGRSGSRREAIIERYNSQEMTGGAQIDGRALAHRSIVTASRVDAIV